MIKKFWEWLTSLFTPTKIPQEVYDDTTAPVIPENYNPDEVVDEVNDIINDTPESPPIPLVDDEDEIPIDPPIPLVDDETLPSKYAFLIGINKYDPILDADLSGCVNDVESMYKVLTETYKFPLDNVRMLTDYRATKENIVDGITWLLSHIIPGDELVLHYSGHGSQVRDIDGDELDDNLDEILCPTDLDWDNPLTDDDIAGLFRGKVDGVNLTFISDSCHSGSVMKLLNEPQEYPPKVRYLRPPNDIMYRSINRDLPLNEFGSSNKDTSSTDKHVLLSGCKDDQTSADAYIDGKWQGALTSSLIKAIKKNPHRDLLNIHADIIGILNLGGYTQKPQLSGDVSLTKNRNIFGS